MIGSPPPLPKKPPRWKFREDEILIELAEYIKQTYSEHYSGDSDDTQTFEVIAKSSRLERGFNFAVSSGMKYFDRTPNKVGQERKDLLKAIHFGMLALYCYDKMQTQKEKTTDETVRKDQTNSK